jgi:hypothetical protein
LREFALYDNYLRDFPLAFAEYHLPSFNWFDVSSNCFEIEHQNQKDIDALNDYDTWYLEDQYLCPSVSYAPAKPAS